MIIIDENLNTIYSNYIRHNSDTKNTLAAALRYLSENYSENTFAISLTGSGAISASKHLKIPFIQEVISCKNAVKNYIPETDVVIELGRRRCKNYIF